MPDLLCQHCGTLVKVRGLAAVCPNCKELVTPPPPSLEGQEPSPLESLPPRLFPQASNEAPLPAPPLPIPEPKVANDTWKIVGVTLGALITLMFVIDYVRLRLRPPTVVQVVQQAPPTVQPTVRIVPSTLPTTQRASIFEDAPTDAQSPPQQVKPAPREVASAVPVERARQSDVAPSSTPATQNAKPPHPYAALAAVRPQAPKQTSPERISDDEIGRSIQKGVDFILAQFASTRLKGADSYDPETFAGLNALCVYALLHAGQAVADPRLTAQAAPMKALIDRMKEFPMDGNRATYARSLRISALAVYDRPEDRAILQKDAEWLIATSQGGAYTYGKPPDEHATRDKNNWDNSNSQYGALGVWAATEAGFRAPAQYWSDVENHWIDAQAHSGGWGYGPGAQQATLAMTSAGVTSLFIAREQLGTTPSAAEKENSVALPRAIQLGLEWLDEGDHAIDLGGHRGYTLYGLERAGLASGYKFFGKHDWYLTLAAQAMKDQHPDGSWDGGDGTMAETAFTVLFLSRGRHPIFVSKLRFAGTWANRPRDVANLTRFAGRELERPLNWQTVGLERDWTEWTDSPVLFISSDQAPNFSDADLEKFRAYVESGGMLFTHADRSSPAFTKYVEGLAERLFPNYPLTPIADDHLVRSVMFPSNGAMTPLLGVSNGARLLLVHSPTDLGRAWTVRPINSNRPAYETAINVIVYAAGRREFRNRLNSIYVAEPSDAPLATVPVARLRYKGGWDPEPGAWKRFARVLQKQTSLTASATPVDVPGLTYETAPIAHLTGTGAFALADAEIDALRQYVVRGGVLLIDACGGSPAFNESVQKNLLPKLFPSNQLQQLDASHALLSASGDAMSDLGKPQYRPFAIETRGKTPGGLWTFSAGKGQVIVSDLDLASGLLGTGTWGIAGYQPQYAQDFVKNLVLWTIERIRRENR